MSDNFDDLSDDFLNEDKDKSNKPKRPKGPIIRKGRTIRLEGEEGMPIDLNQLPDDLPPEIRNIIKTISDIKERGGSVEDELNLGTPDEHEHREKDGNTMDKDTWNTDFGSVTRISIGGDIPSGLDGESIRDLFRNKFGIGPRKKKELTLEEKLERAEEVEDYLECARLKALIDEKKEDSQPNFLLDALKDLKKSENSENSGNVDTDKDSEGDFWDLLD